MSSYADALAAIERDGKIKRCYYVHGEVAALREDIVGRIVIASGAAPHDVLTLSAATAGTAQVWAEVGAVALTPTGRVVIIREAEALSTWTPFLEWLALGRAAAPTTVVMVSALATWPQRDGEFIHPEVRSKIMASAACVMVRCNPVTERDAADVISRWAGCEPGVSTALLRRCGGDWQAVRDAARKMPFLRAALSSWGGVRADDRALVERVCQARPRDEFVTALTERRKDRALAACAAIDISLVSSAIGMLAANLEALARINRALKREDRLLAVVERTRLHRAVVADLMPHAGPYDPARVRVCAAILAAAETALAEGAEEGVLEMVVAGW